MKYKIKRVFNLTTFIRTRNEKCGDKPWCPDFKKDVEYLSRHSIDHYEFGGSAKSGINSSVVNELAKISPMFGICATEWGLIEKCEPEFDPITVDVIVDSKKWDCVKKYSFKIDSADDLNILIDQLGKAIGKGTQHLHNIFCDIEEQHLHNIFCDIIGEPCQQK